MQTSSELRSPQKIVKMPLAQQYMFPLNRETEPAHNEDSIHPFMQSVLKKIEKTAPKEFKRQTGKLILTMARVAQGLDKSALAASFYPNYSYASPTLKHSLNDCLAKLLQRARRRFECYGLDIVFCKRTRRWQLTYKPSRLTAGF